jgi:hypothetical protein
MLKRILGLIAVVIVVVLVLALFQPASFRLERTVVINAAPDKIAPLIQDFHNWSQWSPWADMDPNMKTSYSGAASGVGAVYEWEGNSKVGKGRMEIVTATPTSTSLKLDFLKPVEGHNIAEFTLQPQGGATQVTWAMYGPNNYMAKVMHVFISMDKLVGGDFEKGLARMKTAAERS